VTTVAQPLGGTWQLVELEGEPVPPAGAVRAPHLVFDAEESLVSGSGGCNRLAGSFELSGEDLRFGPMAVTKMACADDVMRREDVFLRALGSVTRHELDGATLALFADERVVARLTQQLQA
jgi:heat shock protein HslJ